MDKTVQPPAPVFMETIAPAPMNSMEKIVDVPQDQTAEKVVQAPASVIMERADQWLGQTPTILQVYFLARLPTFESLIYRHDE